jgi:hypothetical protein
MDWTVEDNGRRLVSNQGYVIKIGDHIILHDVQGRSLMYGTIDAAKRDADKIEAERLALDLEAAS